MTGKTNRNCQSDCDTVTNHNAERRRGHGRTEPLLDRRTDSTAQASLTAAIDNSSTVVAQRMDIDSVLGDTLQQQSLEDEEEEPLQGKLAPGAGDAVQRQKIPSNKTGLPDELKHGIEALSGIDISDVRVHHNSSKPAQLNAAAYTQGTDVHVAPGQEHHLPHEAWHAVQQKQGRVRATGSIAGKPLNDNLELEREADKMGAQALRTKSKRGG